MAKRGELVSGDTAAAHVAHALSDVLLLQPFSSGSSSSYTGAAAVNMEGKCVVQEVGAAEASGSSLLHSVVSGKDSTLLTGSSFLKQMLPQLYQLAEQDGVVIHVASHEHYQSSLLDVSLVRETGFAILSSSTTQEAHDMALAAHLLRKWNSSSIIHFFDAPRVASAFGNLHMLDAGRIQELEKEGSQGKAPVEVEAAVDKVFEHIEPVCGRRYKAYEYHGEADAETVVIAMGVAGSVIREKLSVLSKRSKAGCLNIRLYRPFSAKHFLDALPQTTKKVCVVDQMNGALFGDIAAAFHSGASARDIVLVRADVVPTNGFTPSMVEQMESEIHKSTSDCSFKLHHNPTTHVSVQSSDLVYQVNYCSLGFSNADSATEACAQVLGPCLNLHVQQVDLQDVASSDLLFSQLRFAPIPIIAQYPISDADMLMCDNPSALLLPGQKLVSSLKQAGGKVVINCGWSLQDVERTLTDDVKSALAHKQAELYLIDATGIATSCGAVASSSSWVLQAVLMLLCESGSMSYSQAYPHLCSLVKERMDSVQVANRICEALKEDALHSKVTKAAYQASKWMSAAPHSDKEDAQVLIPIHMTKRKLDAKAKNENIIRESYCHLLKQALGDRLALADTNATQDNVPLESGSLETYYGEYLAKLQSRRRLVEFVKTCLNSNSFISQVSKTLVADLGTWVNGHNSQSVCSEIVPRILKQLGSSSTVKEVAHIKEHESLLAKTSRWIIGGEHWAYDLASSGIHHVIASGEDVNVLVLDNESYGESSDGLSKKDIGLYAMNYGGAYVASVSMLSSHAQALRAIAEADAYHGPSIVLAHAPSVSVQEDALASLEEAARTAVDAGVWPLYRWNPLNTAEPFVLDSSKLKAEIQEFLSREQQLSLMASEMKLPSELSHSVESKLASKHKELKTLADQRKLTAQFESLSQSLGNADLQLLVLYGSDGGNAASVAEVIAKKAEMSGCGEVRYMEANEFPVEELSEEKHVVYVLATAGQGEHCANAKTHMETLMSSKSKLPGLKAAVFGLGDSHYWGEGTPDSAKYFCKPAKDAEAKLKELGANIVVPVGLGDDQNDDGYDGELTEWEPALWEALDVKIVEGEISGGAPKIIDDDIKGGSNFLRGMIDEGLRDRTTLKLLPEDTKLTKFHGIYQQDLRSVREELDAKGLERAYSFMIRIGVPAGVATCEQYIAMDELCSTYANGALKLTTRQAFQLHGVVKKNLKTTMQGINRACMDTLAACGDVNRNVIGNPHHRLSLVHREVNIVANKLSTHLKPRTSAYHEIWLDKKRVAGSIDEEPIYGKTYLPRKFKIAIAVPPLNDVDVFAHCFGLIAIVENGKLQGWNVTVGGGMGTTHGDKLTYPRLADVLGFVTTDKVVKVAESVVILQRDHGERTNRKHARLKYTVEDHGVDWFRTQVEKMCGFKIEKQRPFKFETNADPYGWNKGIDGLWDYTMYVENGYIKDREGYPIKTALRAIAEFHTGGEMNLTANQNLIIGGVSEARKPQIMAMLQKYKIDNSQYSAMRLHSMACVALPTCALAMAESQTYLPSLIGKLEETLDEAGLKHDAITIRMTGCPNGCARPYVAEIAFVGKAPGNYNLYLGAGHSGNRINKMYKEGINEDQILEILRPMLRRYAKERNEGERFGDWVIRAGIIEPTLQGKYFWSHGDENKLDTPSGTYQIYW